MNEVRMNDRVKMTVSKPCKQTKEERIDQRERFYV